MPLLLLIHFLFSDSFSIKHVIQWLIGSHLCFVLFYVPLCFANSIFPGWLTASMWQITIVLGVLISPLINTTKNSRYRIPRQKIPLSILPWLFLILIDVALTVLNYLMVDGVIATGLFFHATSLVMTDMKKLANIESTQSMEIIFSILLGIIILGNSLPNFVIVLGIVIIILGIYGGNMNR
ncbi:multidrug resistance efflux transporter family protein [Leuconostoc gasicomitatum]|nr:multidrug resistance efflux transporter family protein [Leuconostoc gasicomitatum]